jgi:hypothetical protein
VGHKSLAILGSGASSAVVAYVFRQLFPQIDIDIWTMRREVVVYPFTSIESEYFEKKFPLLPRILWKIHWTVSPENYKKNRWGDLHHLVGDSNLSKEYPTGQRYYLEPQILCNWLIGISDVHWKLLASPFTQEEIHSLTEKYTWVVQTFPNPKHAQPVCWEWIVAFPNGNCPEEKTLCLTHGGNPPETRCWEYGKIRFQEYRIHYEPPIFPEELYRIKFKILHPSTKPIPPVDEVFPNLIYIGRYALWDFSFSIESIPDLLYKILNTD